MDQYRRTSARAARRSAACLRMTRRWKRSNRAGSTRRRRRPAESLPRFETPIVPTGDDRRPRAGRGRRHHDLSRLADDRRGHAGARRGGRMAVRGRRARSPSRSAPRRAATSRPTSRGRCHRPRGLPASRTCGPIPRRSRRACSSRGSAPGCSSTICRCRGMIVVRIASGAAPDLAATAPDADRRRSSGASLDDHRGFVERMRAMVRRGARGRDRLAAARAGRDRALGRVRDPRRDGDQSSGDRSAAFHRRQGQLHCRALSAPLPAAGLGGRADRRRQRHCTVRACRTHQRPARRHGGAATSSRPCSVPFRSGHWGTWRCWRRSA